MRRNNLVALGIHAIIIVYAFSAYAISWSSSLDGRVALAIFFAVVALITVAGYILLGYVFLMPLPRKNLLSVSLPAVILILVVVAECAFHVLIIGTFTNQMFISDLLNFGMIFGFAAVTSIFTPSVGLGDTGVIERVITFFVVAPLPSLFMYLGLRLKMYGQSRASKAAST